MELLEPWEQANREHRTVDVEAAQWYYIAKVILRSP
jgi:hypothetical protein